MEKVVVRVMSQNSNPTIDINLQMRVQIALDQWAQGNHSGMSDRVLAFADKRGEIILRGHVSGRGLSEEAMVVAQAVPGVRLVFNQIAFRRPQPLNASAFRIRQ
jgi:osmotically-inducible protein OsmY